MSHDDDEPRSTFGRTLVKVMSVQIVTLAIMWLLQSRYTP